MFSGFFTGCSSEAPNLEPYQLPEEQLAANYMVSAANPLAAEAGLSVLRRGGNAVDAAVAVQMMLTFTEPPESGIGGGAFMLHFDSESGAMTMFDGRETAPAAATNDRFQWLGFSLPLWLAVPTGKSVGVPGTVAMLYDAHSKHGSLPWPELFEEAITAARDGIPYPEQLKKQVNRDYSLQFFGDMRRYFVYQARGEEPQLKNEALAETFEMIAREGPAAFYDGPLSEDIMSAASSRLLMRSDMTLDDLKSYAPAVRDVVCGTYRELTLCGPAPPSSGGISVLQILGILEQFNLTETGPGTAASAHLIAEASRLAFADRNFYIGDPDFTDVPVAALTDSDYLKMRAALVDKNSVLETAYPGDPVNSIPEIRDVRPPDEQETTGTTHFSIVDGYGNAVSMTSSIEAPFGSRIMTRGFLLNNQLTDFTFDYKLGDRLHPNAPEPGKRPRSSMAPFLVFDADGDLQMVVGSRGGSRIIGYVVKTLVGVIDWELSMQEAISLPNIVHRGEGLELEYGTEAARLKDELEAKGHRVQITTMESGIHGIEWLREANQWRGGADPRLGGKALGD